MSSATANRLTAALDAVGWSIETLWIHSVALGGTLSQLDISAACDGTSPPSAHEYSILAVALNEHHADTGAGHLVPHRP